MRKTVLLILLFSLAAWGCRGDRDQGPAAKSKRPGSERPVAAAFVKVKDGRFVLAGKPYYFVGANFWQGMNLGVDGPSGDRARLLRELDRMRDLGLTNLRVMASSEGPNTEPYRMVPALMTSPGEYDGSVLDGLDFLLAEMGKRGMRAVMVLNNFWQWSGGMAQYVSWHEKTPIPYPGDYEKFIAYSAKFYGYPECQDWFRDHIAMLADRTNPYTGIKYRDDPAVFSWELGNEPRRYPQSWIDETSAYIKSLDANHMVTTGSEGAPPEEATQDFVKTHSAPGIDYATIHIWPQNWGWYDPKRPATYKAAEPLAVAYSKSSPRKRRPWGNPSSSRSSGWPASGCPAGTTSTRPRRRRTRTSTMRLSTSSSWTRSRPAGRRWGTISGPGPEKPGRACPGWGTRRTSRPVGTRSTTPTLRRWPSSRPTSRRWPSG